MGVFKWVAVLFAGAGFVTFVGVLLNVRRLASSDKRWATASGFPYFASYGEGTALLAVRRDTAAVRHVDARLAWNVRAEIPRRTRRVDSDAEGERRDLRHPLVLRLGPRLDDGQALVAHVGEQVGEPFHVLL